MFSHAPFLMYLSSLIPTLVNEFVDGNTTVENIHVQMFVILGGVVLVGTLVSSAISLSLSLSLSVYLYFYQSSCYLYIISYQEVCIISDIKNLLIQLQFFFQHVKTNFIT